MRKLFGIGTPRGLQAEGGLFVFVRFVWFHITGSLHRWYRLLRSPDVHREYYVTAA